ncbi:hypothetical protein ACLB2K_076632 [Fragaria x ananassa]
MKRPSYIALVIGTFTFILLETPDICVAPDSPPPQKPQLCFPRHSCDHRPRQHLPLHKKNKRLWSSSTWCNQVRSFSLFFHSLHQIGLFHNHSQALCVSAGAGHEVMVLTQIGVADVTGVKLLESLPLISRADPHNLPFFDDVFDFAFSAMLEQTLFPSRFATEMERTVRPGGLDGGGRGEEGDYGGGEGKRDRSLLDVFKSKEEVKEEVEKEAKETKTEESLLDKAKNYVAEKIANVPTPEASLIDVDFMKVSFDSADYLAKVNVKNPYSHSIPICEIDYTLKSIGSVIASGRIPDPGSLKASCDTLIDVPVKVPHSIIITLVKDIATDWDIDYELELGLIIDIPIVGNITIPLSRKGEIKLPTLKDVIFGTNEE